jgi:hypothetical protein
LERLAPDTAILATFIQAHAAPFHCPELLLIANVLGATFFREAPQFGGGTDRNRPFRALAPIEAGNGN